MERKGKLLLAATDETPSSAFVPVNVIQLELEKEVECANSASHIARPCPSAAGDYMDYGMIRTPPPLPPSLPGFTLDLNTQRKVLTSEERPPVSPPSPRKSVVFPWRPESQMSDPSVNYRSAEQRGVSWKGQAGVLRCTLAEAETWGYWRHSAELYLWNPSSVSIWSHNVGPPQRRRIYRVAAVQSSLGFMLMSNLSDFLASFLKFCPFPMTLLSAIINQLNVQLDM